MNDINQELGKAVLENNLKEVKILLSAGADPNFKPESRSNWENGNKLLHYAKSAEIAKELLLKGARIDSKNDYRETPLLTAIPYGRNAELVRELLKHGAYVNETDRQGDTPLNRVVKNRGNLNVITELLDYGADINRKNRFGFSPLDNATGFPFAGYNPKYPELLIKITVLKHFDTNYRNIINLSEKCCYDKKILSYPDDCACELTKMKSDIIMNNISLYELITTKEANKKLYFNDGVVRSIGSRVFEVVKSTCYPIYRDVISSKVGEILERMSLLNKLSEVKVYTKLDTSDHAKRVSEKTVVLDSDSKSEVAQYLSNKDLLHLIVAFDKPTDQPSCLKRSFSESNILSDPTVNEASTSNHVKHARYE